MLPEHDVLWGALRRWAARKGVTSPGESAVLDGVTVTHTTSGYTLHIGRRDIPPPFLHERVLVQRGALRIPPQADARLRSASERSKLARVMNCGFEAGDPGATTEFGSWLQGLSPLTFTTRGLRLAHGPLLVPVDDTTLFRAAKNGVYVTRKSTGGGFVAFYIGRAPPVVWSFLSSRMDRMATELEETVALIPPAMREDIGHAGRRTTYPYLTEDRMVRLVAACLAGDTKAAIKAVLYRVARADVRRDTGLPDAVTDAYRAAAQVRVAARGFERETLHPEVLLATGLIAATSAYYQHDMSPIRADLTDPVDRGAWVWDAYERSDYSPLVDRSLISEVSLDEQNIGAV